MNSPLLTRRDFSLALFGTLAISTLPNPVLAALESAPTRSLSFKSLHTLEEGKICYMRDGAYCPQGLKDINHLLRDHRTGDIAKMDPALLDLLYALEMTTGAERRFDVISGYRSPATNAMLRGKSNGVAKLSYHMRGMAIDISVPEVNLAQLHKNALAMKAGGVGLYASSGFIHVDTGPVRTW